MEDNYNTHLFDYVYYNTITTNSIKTELLFPPTKGNNEFSDMVKKINLTVGATTPAVNNLLLLNENESYKYLDYPNSGLLSLSPTMVDIFNLIPVIVEVRVFNNKYHIQTKTKDIVISKKTYNKIINDGLSITERLSGENSILYKHDKYYREGVYHRVSVRAGLLYKECLTIEDLLDLNLDLTNYEYIHLNLPETLYSIPSFINNTMLIKGLYEIPHSWIPVGFIDDIVNADINNVKSHIIRKFIYDIQTTAVYFFTEKSDNFNNINLLINYLERVWTDGLRHVLNKEFPDITTNDFIISRKFKKFTLLRKKGCINKVFKIPESISYYKDKEFILNKIVEQSCSN